MSTYWTGSGSLNPHSLLIWSIGCCVAFCPAIRRAGSPFGITLKIRKVTTEIANRTATMPTRRRAMNAPIPIGQASVLKLTRAG